MVAEDSPITYIEEVASLRAELASALSDRDAVAVVGRVVVQVFLCHLRSIRSEWARSRRPSRNPAMQPSPNSFIVLDIIERPRTWVRAAAARNAPSCSTSSTTLASADTKLGKTAPLGGGCGNPAIQVRRRLSGRLIERSAIPHYRDGGLETAEIIWTQCTDLRYEVDRTLGR